MGPAGKACGSARKRAVRTASRTDTRYPGSFANALRGCALAISADLGPVLARGERVYCRRKSRNDAYSSRRPGRTSDGVNRHAPPAARLYRRCRGAGERQATFGVAREALGGREPERSATRGAVGVAAAEAVDARANRDWPGARGDHERERAAAAASDAALSSTAARFPSPRGRPVVASGRSVIDPEPRSPVSTLQTR
jgi:hypothetical protein